MSTEQRTPDELTAENELICEKLLGWKRTVRGKLSGCQFWNTEPSQIRTLAFTTWEEAGLILEALQAKLAGGNFNTAAWDQLRKMGHLLSLGKLAPADIRVAAVAFIKAWHGE